MTMHVGPLASGSRGFDANVRLDATTATAFRQFGYTFAVRYVRRAVDTGHDLTSGELATLLQAGLAVMAVQHVESETSWIPSREKGMAHGATAAKASREAGLPMGVCVWLDLEGVARGTPAAEVTAHCRSWYTAVATAGFTPGVYVGWRAGLTPRQLYLLPFEHYWASYNLNADEEPAVRGVQMRQTRNPAPSGRPQGVGFAYDEDVITTDARGGRPLLVIP